MVIDEDGPEIPILWEDWIASVIVESKKRELSAEASIEFCLALVAKVPQSNLTLDKEITAMMAEAINSSIKVKPCFFLMLCNISFQFNFLILAIFRPNDGNNYSSRCWVRCAGGANINSAALNIFYFYSSGERK